MKYINKNELLNLSDSERARILKYIALGRVKYIGGGNNETKP